MNKTKAASELAIIPRWARILAAVLFAGGLVVGGFVVFAAPGLGLGRTESLFLLAMMCVVGSLLAGLVLLTGYVNRDAKRRGMNAVLWTILVLVIPHALGFVVYFLVREPRRTPCPACAAPVPAGGSYCPSCGSKMDTAARATP
jgi:hypothetical protein